MNSARIAATVLLLGMALSSIPAAVHATGSIPRLRAPATRSRSLHCKKQNQATGTIKYSATGFPDTLNPYQTSSAVSLSTIYGLLDDLVRYDNHVHLFPMLAREVPSVKNGGIREGGKVLVIRLKKGLRWSNNSEITSADVKFGWQIDMDPASGPWCAGSCDVISQIDIPDRYTAVLHLKTVYAPAVPYALMDPWPRRWENAWNNDPHTAALKLAQDQSFNFEGPSYPTDGPYQVVQFIRDDRIVLRPMTYYRGMVCGAYLKNLIFTFYSNAADLVAAAESQQTDVTLGSPISALPELNRYRHSIKVSVAPSFAFRHLEYNVDPLYNGRANPLHDTKVRQALTLALDKLGLIESSLGISRKTAEGLVAWTPLINTPKLVQPFADTSIRGQWDPLVRRFVIPGQGRALQDARKLLSGTRWKNGFSLDLVTTNNSVLLQAQATIIAANWKRLGVTVNAQFFPGAKLFADFEHGGIVQQGAFQVADFGIIGSPDPDQLKFSMQSRYIDRRKSTHSVLNANVSGITNRAIDRAFDRAAHTIDRKLRYRYYAFIQRAVNQLAYWVPLYFVPSIVTSDGRVAHFSANPTQYGPTWNMYAWKLLRD